MNHTELLAHLNENTRTKWHDSSDMHGWTVGTHLDENTFMDAGFPENNEEPPADNNIVQISITTAAGDLIIAMQYSLEEGGIGLDALCSFVDGIVGGEIVAYG